MVHRALISVWIAIRNLFEVVMRLQTESLTFVFVILSLSLKYPANCKKVSSISHNQLKVNAKNSDTEVARIHQVPSVGVCIAHILTKFQIVAHLFLLKETIISEISTMKYANTSISILRFFCYLMLILKITTKQQIKIRQPKICDSQEAYTL